MEYRYNACKHCSNLLISRPCRSFERGASAWKKSLAENARQQNAPDPDPHITRSEPLPGVGNGWTGRLVSGTMTLRGKPFVFTGMMLGAPPPGADGGWLLQVTVLGASAGHAAEDMPALIAMQQSEKVDLDAVRNQTMRNIARINEQTARWLAANKAAGDAARNARFESSMKNAAAARNAMSQSTAGFLHYINDQAVLQHNPTGLHGTTDANFAAALEKADPQNFSVVPVNQYIPGIDY